MNMMGEGDSGPNSEFVDSEFAPAENGRNKSLRENMK